MSQLAAEEPGSFLRHGSLGSLLLAKSEAISPDSWGVSMPGHPFVNWTSFLHLIVKEVASVVVATVAAPHEVIDTSISHSRNLDLVPGPKVLSNRMIRLARGGVFKCP